MDEKKGRIREGRKTRDDGLIINLMAVVKLKVEGQKG